MVDLLENTYLQPVLLLAVFLLLMVLEFVVPLRRRRRNWSRRVFVNLVMAALAGAVGTFITRATGLSMAYWTREQGFGLLNWMGLPPVFHFLVGFLLMDLTFYYWHLANHLVPVMWRFHNVHHIDPELDVTTAFRFHFVEILYSTLFRIAQVGLIGVLPMTYVVYELIFAMGTIFHHSNVRLPIGLERVLNRVIVTPRMHGIHHSVVREETNSNFSVVFRWWDLLHRTLRLGIPQSQVHIGVAAYNRDEDNGLMHLILVPFGNQRDYWRFPDGTRPEREPRVQTDGPLAA